MTADALPNAVQTPEVQTRLLKGLGYPRDEVVAGIVKHFELTPEAAGRIFDATVVR